MLLVYVCLIDPSVYTQCKANSNIANFTLPVIIKCQVLHFYTSKAKLLSGTVFSCPNIYIIIAFYDFILYRYSSSTKDMYTLLLSVKEECCWRDLHGYCTLHPVRMNFENFIGGSSTVYAVSSKIPYQGSSNHYNLFLKVISCQCKLQLYMYG